MEGTLFGVSWPEGQPEHAYTWTRRSLTREIWAGLKTWWPSPLNARRIYSVHWFWPDFDGTDPVAIAERCEEAFARGRAAKLSDG